MAIQEDNRSQISTFQSSFSAALKVFGTFELAEAIILLLPAKDVLLLQRVHSTWRATIASSSKLQQVLFLAPVPLKQPRHKYTPDMWDESILPISNEPALRLHDYMMQPDHKPVINPLIELLCPIHNLGSSGAFHFFNESRDPGPLLDAAATSSESIWKMALVQPPSQHVMIERLAHRQHTMPNRYWSYIRGAGDAVTVAELLLHMLELRWHGKPGMYFAIRRCSYDSSGLLDPYKHIRKGLDIMNECIYR